MTFILRRSTLPLHVHDDDDDIVFMSPLAWQMGKNGKSTAFSVFFVPLLTFNVVVPLQRLFFLISIHFLISLHILQFVLMLYMFRSISPSIYLNVLLVPHPFPAVRPWEISVLEWVIYFTSIFKLAKRAKMRKFSTIRSCLGGPEFGALVE